MISVNDVHKRYLTDHGPGDWVLRGVNLTIPPRVNVGLVGRNGAGKSTLLRLIGGIDIPTRGTIERNCRVSWPMGFGGGLQGSLTGRQNAKFVCRIHGHQDDMRDRIAGIEEFAELGSHFDDPVKSYSSGMRSRLNFALSMAFDFDVYISDEVTAAGDAAFRNKAESAFKKLSDHASIIMVSHGEGTLKRFCTAGIWLHEGQVHWFDDINDALREYKKSLPGSEKLVSLNTSDQTTKHPMIARINSLRRSLITLEAGIKGMPAAVSEVDSVRYIQHAKKIGMELLTEKQIAERGYILRKGEAPMLRMSSTSTQDQQTDFYDLGTQCEQIAVSE